MLQRRDDEEVQAPSIDGYQVMKKWLSYRERRPLGRDLTMEEAEYVAEMARRIAAILLMTDAQRLPAKCKRECK